MSPLVSCLCPTYKRHELVSESVRYFLAQDHDNRELIILDDEGFAPIDNNPPLVNVVRSTRRFRSLPEKYNALAGLARGEVLAIWEDDDVYHPWHLSAAVAALQDADWCKPSKVLQLVNGKEVVQEDQDRYLRFHASIAMRREAFDFVGGYPATKRADYDHQLQFAFRDGELELGDPILFDKRPSYVHRLQYAPWSGESLRTGPSDEEWYDRVPQ